MVPCPQMIDAMFNWIKVDGGGSHDDTAPVVCDAFVGRRVVPARRAQMFSTPRQPRNGDKP